MTTPAKDTIYVDIDDEITGIIDKVRGSQAKVVALVLPKRAAVFQSIVNMKLLKRSADESKKHLVLVTSETGLMPLAGAVGLFVAKTPQSKPEIPRPPIAINDGSVAHEESVIMDDDPEEFEPEAAADKPVGDLAAGSASAVAATGLYASQPEDTIDFDNSTPDGAGAVGVGAGAAASKVPKPNKHLKVPSFDKFRLRLALGILGLVLLIVLGYFAFAVLPKASITIGTNAQAIASDLDLTLDTTANAPDGTTLPAQLATTEKTYSQDVAATGQQDEGTKASGTVTLKNCGSDPVSIPAGTGVSAGGLTFITQKSIALTDGNFDSHGNCKSSGSHVGSTDVIAQQNGAQYNLGPRSDYTVAGHSEVSGSDGSGMSGGSSKIVKVVSQSDIDGASTKLNSTDTTSVKNDLKSQLKGQDLYAIMQTFVSGTPEVSSSAAAGDAAETVTVTEKVTYSLYGVQKNYLEDAIKQDVKTQIDTSKQSILDDGLSQAIITVKSQDEKTAQLNIQTTATAGPDIDVNSLKQQIAGKKSGEVKSIIETTPGVKSVEVHFSPFYVTKVPGSSGKVTIVFVKAGS